MKRTLWTTASVVGVIAGGIVVPSAAHAAPEPDSRDDSRCDVSITGHRGASGYRPEHTLASYRHAAKQGADYIEADLVATKDGKLVARHEPEISKTTNVADHPEFADRKTTKDIDGTSMTGWFTEDFTLKELRTLRAKERLPELRPDNANYDGKYPIPTFDEVLTTAEKMSAATGHHVGVYPELKHPKYFRSIDLALEKRVAKTLQDNGKDTDDSVLIQSFDTKALHTMDSLVDNPLAYLIEDDAPGKGELNSIAEWADIVSYTKDLIIPRKDDGSLGKPTRLVANSHKAGLTVHTWTFRHENEFLPTDLRDGDNPADWGNYQEEYERFFATGVDGIFADFPNTAVEARQHCQK